MAARRLGGAPTLPADRAGLGDVAEERRTIEASWSRANSTLHCIRGGRISVRVAMQDQMSVELTGGGWRHRRSAPRARSASLGMGNPREALG